MSKFTSGPWTIYRNEEDLLGLSIAIEATERLPRSDWICEIESPANTEDEANAKLIAKAPDMYAMLRKIIAEPSQLVDDEPIRKLLEEIDKND